MTTFGCAKLADTGNAGVWAQMSADEALGIVYMPVELPTGDYYGGHRHGGKGTDSALCVSGGKNRTGTQ